VKVCGASIATRTGSHLRCLLPDEHKGDCSPRVGKPRNLPTADLLRLSSAMLRDLGADVAEELAVRALRLDQIKAKAAIAVRRGHRLPQELLDLLDDNVVAA
jgi:hypothetical protein